MAERKPTTEQAEQQTGPRRYFIVNPRGAIHEVEREHARERLRAAGWRMATAEEIAALNAKQGRQVFDKPIVRPWTSDPDEALEL